MRLIVGLLKRQPSLDWITKLATLSHETRCVWSVGAEDPLLAQKLPKEGIKIWSSDPFGADHEGTDHISLARWADAFVIPLADAGFIARYAHGHADDFLTLQLMATTCRVLVLPCIPDPVWNHPAVRDNVATLTERGVRVAENQSAALNDPSLVIELLR